MMPIGSYRTDGSDTMMEGARKVGPRLGLMHRRVADIMREIGPLTDPELVAEYTARFGPGIYRSISTRRRELVDAGKLFDTNMRKRNPMTNVSNIVWGEEGDVQCASI